MASINAPVFFLILLCLLLFGLASLFFSAIWHFSSYYYSRHDTCNRLVNCNTPLPNFPGYILLLAHPWILYHSSFSEIPAFFQSFAHNSKTIPSIPSYHVCIRSSKLWNVPPFHPHSFEPPIVIDRLSQDDLKMDCIVPAHSAQKSNCNNVVVVCSSTIFSFSCLLKSF